MANYNFYLTGKEAPFSGPITELKAHLKNLPVIVDGIARDVIMPMLQQHYDSSGIRSHSGLLRQAISKPTARGNIYHLARSSDGSVTVTLGVDYQALPYARFVIEGRGPVKPVKAKVLRFYDENGQPIFRKSVGPAPPHDIYFLSGQEQEKIHAEFLKRVMA